MNYYRWIFLLALISLIPVFPSFSQTMTAYYPGHELKFDLEEIDSVTFENDFRILPHEIKISIEKNGCDYAACWYLEVDAMVKDVNGNPCQDGIIVYFDVLEEIATISSSITGNTSMNGECAKGVAHTYLTYNRSNSNNNITITTSVFLDSVNFISDTLHCKLPLLVPNVDIQSDHTQRTFLGEYVVFEIEASVLAEFGSYANNELVRFISSSGQFYTSDSIESSVNPEMLTGDEGQYPDIDPGYARRYLIISREEAFPDPTQTQTTVQVNVILPNSLTRELFNESLILTLNQVINN